MQAYHFIDRFIFVKKIHWPEARFFLSRTFVSKFHILKFIFLLLKRLSDICKILLSCSKWLCFAYFLLGYKLILGQLISNLYSWGKFTLWANLDVLINVMFENIDSVFARVFVGFDFIPAIVQCAILKHWVRKCW